MVGTSLIMGGLVCFFDLLTQRTKAASFTATRYVTFCGDRLRIAQDDLKLGIFAVRTHRTRAAPSPSPHTHSVARAASSSS